MQTSVDRNVGSLLKWEWRPDGFSEVFGCGGVVTDQVLSFLLNLPLYSILTTETNQGSWVIQSIGSFLFYLYK